MRNLLVLVLFLSTTLGLGGCVGMAAEGVRAADSENTRAVYMESAMAGDADAQFKVGSAYCCTPGDSQDGYYDNFKATEFLCMAARQGHADAALKLGKIHSGDRIDGVRLLRRAVTAVAGSDKANLQVAAYWLTQAQQQGSEEAQSLLAKLPTQDISEFSASDSAPCTWQQVYGDQ
ncbi:hypothetical protein P2G88_08740 [Aliiglaciecola sp. CAU 1673]|uniref:hypothetical protein n=1 Tax=Aliiglaciecola sp. CAU 1673 TaxID=3032595 RepID=UPI0023DC9C17|nr:hypothetical protein [Aliiglaciecola sp. CAU 1673]MDF2178336.1 hypothetical protein [Aliiglaciecola sp. CAU 1673]